MTCPHAYPTRPLGGCSASDRDGIPSAVCPRARALVCLPQRAVRRTTAAGDKPGPVLATSPPTYPIVWALVVVNQRASNASFFSVFHFDYYIFFLVSYIIIITQWTHVYVCVKRRSDNTVAVSHLVAPRTRDWSYRRRVRRSSWPPRAVCVCVVKRPPAGPVAARGFQSVRSPRSAPAAVSRALSPLVSYFIHSQTHTRV